MEYLLVWMASRRYFIQRLALSWHTVNFFYFRLMYTGFPLKGGRTTQLDGQFHYRATPTTLNAIDVVFGEK